MVGTGSRRQMIADLLRPFVDFCVNFRLVRIRVAHDVPVHVAAGGKRGEQRVIDFLDDRLHVPLDDAVQLERLPRRQAGSCRWHISARLIDHEPLLRRHDAAGRPDPHHELIGRLQLLLLPLVAQVAVVLHVAAVELHQPVVVSGIDPVIGSSRRFLQRAPQVVALAS